MSEGSKIAAWLCRSWLWWLGVVVWGTVLFMLSANSHPPAGPGIPHQDKILHAIYFAGGSLCFLIARYGRAPAWPRLAWALTGLLFAAVTGALDEWHQTFTPGRSGNDPGDWLADITGGLIGAWLALRMMRRWRWAGLPQHGNRQPQRGI